MPEKRLSMVRVGEPLSARCQKAMVQGPVPRSARWLGKVAVR